MNVTHFAAKHKVEALRPLLSKASRVLMMNQDRGTDLVVPTVVPSTSKAHMIGRMSLVVMQVLKQPRMVALATETRTLSNAMMIVMINVLMVAGGQRVTTALDRLSEC